MNVWQVILPTEGSTFLSDDLRLLESVEFEQRIKSIWEIIEEVEWKDMDPDTVTRFVMVILRSIYFFFFWHFYGCLLNSQDYIKVMIILMRKSNTIHL